MTLDEILKEIKNSEKIVILTHESPDGDAIGSSLATQFLVQKLGKEADVIIPEYSRLFNFLPNASNILKESSIEKFNIEAVFYPYNDEKLRSLARKHRDIIFSVPNYGFNMENGYRLKDLVDGDNNIGFYPLLRHSKDLYFG